MRPTQVDAIVFDGRSSRPRTLRLTAANGTVEAEWRDTNDPPARWSAAALRWHEALGSTVRRVDLPGGLRGEVAVGPALSAFLAAVDHHDGALSDWYGSVRRVLLALVMILVIALVAYRWILPLVAQGVASALPDSAVAAIDRSVLTTLDRSDVLQPTALAAPRRAAIDAAVAPLLAAHPDLAVRVHFRAAPMVGANAFALPGGDIVVTDALVALAPDASHVAAVIAHELGHVVHRHGLRNLIQASVLATAIGVWTGDFSSIATAGATLVLSAAYSRDFEYEADAFAARALRDAGRSPLLLAGMLDHLAAQHAGASADGAASARWHDYLASHPPTPERIARLRAAAAP